MAKGENRSIWNRVYTCAFFANLLLCISQHMANTLIWLFHDYLLGRRCVRCGRVFTDAQQEDRCPFCGAPEPDWDLQPSQEEK